MNDLTEIRERTLSNNKMVKRLFDILLALLWLALTAPAMLLIAILITWDRTGPVLYRPQMVGQNGRPFSLLRFRTMRLEDKILRTNEERLTRIGRFIRNYSLDHLPMLFNLLKGDLTLVGPRPMEVAVIDMEDPVWQRYFQVKPGLVNYAVLKLGRTWTPGRTAAPELNQELELQYLEKRSPIFDLKLLWKSIRTLITSRGNIKARGEPDDL